MKNFAAVLCLLCVQSFCVSQSGGPPNNQIGSSANSGTGVYDKANSNILFSTSRLNYYDSDGSGSYWALLNVYVNYAPGEGEQTADYEARVYAHPICAQPALNWHYLGKVDRVSASGIFIADDVRATASGGQGELELSMSGYLIYCEVWKKSTNTKVNECMYIAVSN